MRGPGHQDALLTRIDTPLPERAAADRANVLFLSGACASQDGKPLERLEIAVDGHRTPAMAHSVPRPDLSAEVGAVAFRSGFWAIVPLPAVAGRRVAELDLRATLAGGRAEDEALGEIELLPAADANEPVALPADEAPRIAICMATWEPPLDLLERQLASIRAQTNHSWICVISDDGSAPETVAAIERLVDGDSRFVVSSSGQRRGFFHNFERALRMAPAEAEFVALADQDDRWHPEKLDRLLASIGTGSLAYSDARIVTPDGELLSDTYWSRRRNNSSDFTSLMLANTVSGSAGLYRRTVIDQALPFPYASGGLFHDHWLAMVGLAMGGISYVEEPLYDYVQHEQALLGHERAQAWADGGRPLPVRLRHFRVDPDYFYEHWRTTYFQEYCRVALMSRLLLARCGDRLTPQRCRDLHRFVDAEGSAAAVAWLAGRRLRSIAGDDDTLGAEGRLLRALCWRRLLEAQPADERSMRTWLPRRGAFPVDRLSPTAPPPVNA